MGRRLKHKRAEPPKTAPIWPGRPPRPGRGGFAPRGRQGAPDEAVRTVVANKLLYDFTYSAVFDRGPGPDASELAVVPDPGDGVSNPGLIFSLGGFLVFPGDTLDAVITYSIGALSGSAVIDDCSLSTAGSHTQSTGEGFGLVTESFSNNPAGTPLVTQVGPDGFRVNSAHIDFSPYVSVATVTTQIHLESPSNGSDIVTISAIQEHFSEKLPEPYPTVLTGFGLLLLGLRRKRA
jgi:hypothetical protein